MKGYAILPLCFLTAVHFGDAAQGGGLHEAEPVCRADTFYSALCVEALQKSAEDFEKWISDTREGRILISDLLPWYFRDDSYEWYIPKPVVNVKTESKPARETLEEARHLSSFRKQSKKRAFLRASEIAIYMDDLAYHSSSLEEEPVFGAYASDTHFNGRTRTPYSVGSFSFHEDTEKNERAGLYVLLQLEDVDDLEFVTSLIRWVGLSGIGGRRSSGMGKFALDRDPILLQAGDDPEDNDETALYNMLEDENSEIQMALSGVLPMPEEAAVAAKGRGLWLKRSGFTWSEGMEAPVKEKSIYMMAAGSTCPTRMKGRIADVATPAVGHPVYRYGKGFFLGVPKCNTGK